MRVGAIVAERFRIESMAGRGGMGVVYRASDCVEDSVVALKVLPQAGDDARFLHEANLLSEIAHPAIVRHVAHGVTHDARPYLAMEWLDGEVLATRLLTGRLSVAESVALGRRIASGLSALHAKGMVHRDVKPSNIFVVDGAIECAKLIDFGLARRRFDARMTQAGVIIGTLAFMSPEQASAARDLDARSDLFSLGAVLYTCLTGQRPFRALETTALLAKVLLEDPTPVRELQPHVPAHLDQLVSALLSKEPARRPPSAVEVVKLLEASESELPIADDVAEVLSTAEQRVAWVVLLGGLTELPTVAEDERAPASGPEQVLGRVTQKLGGRFDVLASGVGIATFSARATTDIALSASRAALRMHELVPRIPMALAMGLGVVTDRTPVGPAIDRAVELLQRCPGGEVCVDALAAKLISHRFELRETRGTLVLEREIEHADLTRKLLGKPTPCLGRERELDMLMSAHRASVDGPRALVSLVTGPAGGGKSRLRYEILARLAEVPARARVLVARGDAMSAGSSFALAGQLVRSRFGLSDGESAAANRQRLVALVSQRLPSDAEALRVAAFLGEIARVRFGSEVVPALGAARRDPTLMGDAIRNAWLDFLSAEAADGGVILVLEDLHWGDLPSVRLIDAALGALSESPLWVLALARPEVHAAFPRLWSSRECEEIRLPPLPRRAAEELVNRVLGKETPDDVRARVIDLAGGNAFFLEELIRSVAEGSPTLPESVLGMVQLRLEALPQESRRLLRAGSLFGSRFWQRAAVRLAGQSDDDRPDERLQELVARELLSERPSAAFPGEVEYVFRHALLRESAYASLTDEDRVLGHRLAGEWLEQNGELDAFTLAQHYRIGERPERARALFLLAAEQALSGNDLEAAVSRAELALACGPSESEQADCQRVLAQAAHWLGRHDDATRAAEQAMRLYRPGSAGWFWALGDATSAATRTDRVDEYMTYEALALATVPERADDPSAAIRCFARCAAGALKLGRHDALASLLARVAEITESFEPLPPLAAGYRAHLRAAVAYYSGDAVEHYLANEVAISAFDAAGDVRSACNARLNLACAAAEFGELSRAERLLREVEHMSERLGLPSITAFALSNLGAVLAGLGRLDEAFRCELMAVERARALGERLLEGSALTDLSQIALCRGDVDRAEAEARRSVEVLEQTLMHRSQAFAALAQALLAKGRTEEALLEARRAKELLDAVGAPHEGEIRVWLALGEAEFALGQTESARSRIRAARERVRARADRISDAEKKNGFTTRVASHARISQLEAEWCP